MKPVTKKNYTWGFMNIFKHINNFEILEKSQHTHISYLVLIVIQKHCVIVVLSEAILKIFQASLYSSNLKL